MRLSPSAIIATLIFAGVIVRVGNVASGRSLWIDEAALALSIGSRSYSDLLHPLDYDQTAPIGYLWAARAATDAVGVSDQSLRFVAFAASCLLLIALFYVGRRLLGNDGAGIAIALAIFAPTLVYYANEVKPYSSDALVALALLVPAQLVAENNDRQRWTILGLAGALSVWLSAPAVFVLAGIGCVLLWSALRTKGAPQLLPLTLTGALWVVSFGAAYQISYSHAARSQYMQDFWGQAFLSVNGIPELIQSVDVVATVIWSSLIDPNSGSLFLGGAKFAFAIVAVTLMGYGFRFVRCSRGSANAWFLVAPAFVTAVASLLGFYPMASRLVLFLVPFGLLLLAGGVVRVSMVVSPRRRRFLLVCMACALPMAGAGAQSRWAAKSPRWGEIEEVVETLQQRRGDEPVYVYSRGVPTYLFYTTNWENPDIDRLRQIHEMVGPHTPEFENALGRGREVRGEGGSMVVVGSNGCELLGLPTGMRWRHRSGFSQSSPDRGWDENEVSRIQAAASPGIWLIFIHFIDNADVRLLSALERRGAVRTVEVVRHHAALYRYEFRGTAMYGSNSSISCKAAAEFIG